ncbi:MAG TPA: PDZ domain-containing protein [Kofleriaceae bacterium]
MADTQEALLLDKATNKHVLVEVGTKVGNYVVTGIEDDDVILASGRNSLVLSAPEHWRPRNGRDAAAAKTAAPSVEIAPDANVAIGTADDATIPGSVDEAPVDPYAEVAPAPSMISPPVAGAPAAPTAVRSAAAPMPIIAGDDGVRIATSAPTTIGSADPYVDGAEPITAAPNAPTAPATIAPTPAAPAAPVIAPTVLMHSELNATLSDFSKLSASVKGEFTEQGVHLDRVADGSLFAHAGLKTGDTVVAVDNTPLHSLDDAADLYARAGQTRAANISILRAGKPMTLRVLFN